MRYPSGLPEGCSQRPSNERTSWTAASFQPSRRRLASWTKEQRLAKETGASCSSGHITDSQISRSVSCLDQLQKVRIENVALAGRNVEAQQAYCQRTRLHQICMTRFQANKKNEQKRDEQKPLLWLASQENERPATKPSLILSIAAQAIPQTLKRLRQKSTCWEQAPFHATRFQPCLMGREL